QAEEIALKQVVRPASINPKRNPHAQLLRPSGAPERMWASDRVGQYHRARGQAQHAKLVGILNNVDSALVEIVLEITVLETPGAKASDIGCIDNSVVHQDRGRKKAVQNEATAARNAPKSIRQ